MFTENEDTETLDQYNESQKKILIDNKISSVYNEVCHLISNTISVGKLNEMLTTVMQIAERNLKYEEGYTKKIVVLKVFNMIVEKNIVDINKKELLFEFIDTALPITIDNIIMASKGTLKINKMSDKLKTNISKCSCIIL